MQTHEKTYKLVLSALFLALCLVLPMITGGIPTIGNMLLPMHIPVLLCGLICGWPARQGLGGARQKCSVRHAAHVPGGHCHGL